jgi:hypothetical protein
VNVTVPLVLNIAPDKLPVLPERVTLVRSAVPESTSMPPPKIEAVLLRTLESCSDKAELAEETPIAPPYLAVLLLKSQPRTVAAAPAKT